MPTISIDTFFACSLMVSVVIIAIALSANSLGTHIAGIQDLNKEEYLKALSDYIVTSCGTPANWGSNATSTPETLGLARDGSTLPMELDIDKVTRLNSENTFALQYADILKSARLTNIAFGATISQIIDVSISLSSNSTVGDSTEYVFTIRTSRQGEPVMTSLHCYTIAENFLNDSSSDTSTDGTGSVDVNVPNSSAGQVLLVAFARASQDPRMTSYGVYSFGHFSSDPLPNGTYLTLSPLNYTMSLSQKTPDATVERCYSFSHTFASNLTATSNTTYLIPRDLDDSPLILVVTGSNISTHFAEWIAYPQVPLQIGSIFTDSEAHAFEYIVVIKGNFYRLITRLGGLNP